MITDSTKLLDGWLSRAKSRVAAAKLQPAAEEIGRLEAVADGVAFVSGLPSVRLDELLEFKNGIMGFAQTLDKDLVGCVLLDEAKGLEAGETVRGTAAVVRVPVGEALLGRIVDPLGRPLDEGGSITAQLYESIERPAPAIIDRDLVVNPVQTGT
ncbi:MAG: F0F1 ATP synthase subunit alpha, partial [Rhizomicrobium sp.]